MLSARSAYLETRGEEETWLDDSTVIVIYHFLALERTDDITHSMSIGYRSWMDGIPALDKPRQAHFYSFTFGHQIRIPIFRCFSLLSCMYKYIYYSSYSMSLVPSSTRCLLRIGRLSEWIMSRKVTCLLGKITWDSRFR